MRKLFFCFSLCLLLALSATGLALSQDYLLRYGGELDPADPALSPRSLLTLAAFAPDAEPQKDDGPDMETMDEAEILFPAPQDVRPIGQPLLPTMRFGADGAQRPAGLATGFTTLWGGVIALPAVPGATGALPVLSGELSLTGEFVPRAANPQDPSWGSIAPAVLETGIQSLVAASEMPATDHTVILANQQTLEITVANLPTVLLETQGGAANLLLDEGSTLQLTGPIALSDAPLATLSLANSATLRMDYTPTAALPDALALPAVWNLSEEAMVNLTLLRPIDSTDPAAPYTPAVLALSSLGANQINLAPGSSLQVKNEADGSRLFAPAAGVTDGMLQISANSISFTHANNRKTTWDNGTTPFILSLRYDETGRVFSATTTGFSGSTSNTGSLSMNDWVGLSAIRTPEVTKLPDEKEEEEKEPFNGWAIGVDHVYEEGGRHIQIPQPGSHTVSWASKTGDDVTIPAGNFIGFSPVEKTHVVENVRKHQSYEMLYTRNTATRTATIQVNGAGLDPVNLAALRAAAHGNIRLYQGSGYKELPYAVPAEADSTTAKGKVYTHTPAGKKLPYRFEMPDVPAGLTLSASGNTFTLSFGTPPAPNVQINVRYRYSEDGGINYPDANNFPNQDKQMYVPQGQDLTNYTQIRLDPAPAGFTYAGVDVALPNDGDVVTVQYTRDVVNVTGTLTLSPDPIPVSISNEPASVFDFSMVIEGVAVTATPSVSGNAIVADFGAQFTHKPDGTARLGAMTCTPKWPGAQTVAMTDAGGGSYTGSLTLTPYTISIAYQVGGNTFRSASETGYYLQDVTVNAPTFTGLAVSGSGSQSFSALSANQSATFAYDRTDTTKATVYVFFKDLAGMPSEYTATMEVRIKDMETSDTWSSLLVPLTKPADENTPITKTGGDTDATYYVYALPTDVKDGLEHTDISVTVKDFLGFLGTDAGIVTDGYGNITVTYTKPYDETINP